MAKKFNIVKIDAKGDRKTDYVFADSVRVEYDGSLTFWDNKPVLTVVRAIAKGVWVDVYEGTE